MHIMSYIYIIFIVAFFIFKCILQIYIAYSCLSMTMFIYFNMLNRASAVLLFPVKLIIYFDQYIIL